MRSISKKLHTPLLIVLGLMMVTVFFSQNQLEQMYQKSKQACNLAVERKKLQKLYAEWAEVNEAVLAHLLQRSPATEATLNTRLHDLEVQISKTKRARVREHDREMLRLLTDMENLFGEYRGRIQATLELARQAQWKKAVGNQMQITELFNRKQNQLFDQYNRVIDARIEQAQEIARAELASSEKAGWWVLTVALAIFGATGFLLVQQVSRPIKKLEEAARQLSEGNTDIRVECYQKDEIGSLALSFNEMAETIQKQMDYLENLPTPVMVIDKEFTVQYINKAGAAMVGKAPGSCLSQKCYSLFKTDHCQSAECRLAQAMQYDEVRTGETFSHAGKSALPILYSGAPVKDDRGKIAGAVEFVLDISENKNLMQKLQEREAYLEHNVKNLLEAMDHFAEGDFAVQLPVESQDTIGRLFDGFNHTVRRMREVLETLSETVQSTANTSAEISASTDQLAAAASEQSSQAQEVASAVEEMVQTVVENARNTTQAAEAAETNREIAQQGAETVQQTLVKIERISDVIKSSAATVRELGKSGQRIGDIVTVIEDIADQINLLALNAAIEAARAGEQGRGFAVVADEVRVLAEKTAGSTKQIAGMIKNIQFETRKAVESMVEGESEVAEGMKLADKAGEALSKIVVSAEEVMDMTTRIASSNEQQSTTSQEIAQNIESISSVAAEAAEQINQIAQATEGLNRLARELSDVMNKFNLHARQVEMMV